MNARRWFGFNRFALVAVVLLGGMTAGLRAQDQGAPQDQGQQQDPPDRIARVSFIQGDVSLQPASQNGDAPFAAAEINYTLSAGDRFYTGQGGMGELQSDNMALRLGRLSDVTLQNFSQEYVQLGLAQGSLRVRTYSLAAQGAVEIDTSNGAFTVLQAGDVRVSSYPGYGQRPDTTIVTVNAGRVQAAANGVNTVVESGQVLRIDGNEQAQAQFVQMLPMDELDQFDQQRDEVRASAAVEVRDQYVNPGMVGYDDLASYGDWSPSPDYGQVWYPRGVEADWSPYHNGHWAYIAPWGYTWVEAEPWGFAPFHYGRWSQFGGRWGWVPGPPVVRPIYSPALVAFVGGGGFSLSVRVGGGGGGVAAWFPLGPREPFVPWYRASPGYVNRVNVSNIYNRNTVEVRNVYVNRTTNVYVNNNITYVNRDRGTVAVPQQAFAQGRQVRGAQVRVDARQMQQAQVMTRPPEVQGGGRPQPAQGLAPARAVPQQQARPQFQGRFQGQGGQGAQGRGQRGPGAQGNGQQQRFGQQPVSSQQQQPGRQQPQQQAPPTVNEGRPAGQVIQTPTPARVPGGMRPQNPGNSNPDLPPNQTTQRPAPQGQDLAPVGGGRNVRPADPGVVRPGAPASGRPDGQQRPGQDVNAPVGGGRNERPADPGVVRPVTPVAPPAGRSGDGRDLAVPGSGGRPPVRQPDPGGARPVAPVQQVAPSTDRQDRPDRSQRPVAPAPATPAPQQQIRPQPTPAPPQQQVRPQPAPAAPAPPQVRTPPQQQLRQGPPPPQQQQRQAPPPRPAEHKEEPK